MESAERNDAQEISASYQAKAALREAEAGKREQAHADARAAAKLAANRDVRQTRPWLWPGRVIRQRRRS